MGFDYLCVVSGEHDRSHSLFAHRPGAGDCVCLDDGQQENFLLIAMDVSQNALQVLAQVLAGRFSCVARYNLAMTPEKAAADNHYETQNNHEAENAPDTTARDVPDALTPETLTGLKTGPIKSAAAGVPAVVSSLQHIYQEMGAVRGGKTLLRLNQKGGFDCPGCAWPDPDDKRSMMEFCENGAKAVAEEATLERVTPHFFTQWSVHDLAEQSDFWLGKRGRLTHPMWLRPGATHYEPISWNDAFQLIASELNALDSPDEAVFYTSGRTSNEAAWLYQLFVRQFGTNNLPDCSNMCHESSGCALTETIGVGKGTVTLGDFDEADAIFVIGQNPGTNHPRMLTALQKAAHHGCKIVSINPLPETGLQRFKHPQHLSGIIGPGTALADLWLPVRINGDVALLKGILKAMLEAEDKAPGQFDHDFIAEHTSGYDAFVEDLRACDWDAIIENCGIARAQIEEAAQIALGSKRMIVCWAMGMTQHKNAVAGIQEIVNLLLLGGHIGRAGAGVCPVRGHSNVQGDRTMGIWEKPGREFLDALEKQFNFQPPREHGLDVVESILAMHDGRAKIFFWHGRQLPFGHARHQFHRPGAATLQIDRSGFDQAQSWPSDYWRTSADFAVSGPHRARRANERRAVCQRRKFDGRRAFLARHLTARLRTIEKRTGDCRRISSSDFAQSQRCELVENDRRLRPDSPVNRKRDRRL